MTPMLIALIGTLIGAFGLRAIDIQLNTTTEVKAIESAVESEPVPELTWMEEDWNNRAYVDMIHQTQAKEQDAFGYIVTVCLCDSHEWARKLELIGEDQRRVKEEFIDLDIDKVNAATRAQKLVTYKTYYNSKDNPDYKPAYTIDYDKALDRYNRDLKRVYSIPPDRLASDHGIRAGTINPSFVPDPYSEKMRLKEQAKFREVKRVKHYDPHLMRDEYIIYDGAGNIIKKYWI